MPTTLDPSGVQNRTPDSAPVIDICPFCDEDLEGGQVGDLALEEHRVCPELTVQENLRLGRLALRDPARFTNHDEDVLGLFPDPRSCGNDCVNPHGNCQAARNSSWRWPRHSSVNRNS